jgi:hypothetical protein
MSGSAKGAKAFFTGTIPVSTAKTGPMREVTGIGTGSVIHHVATKVIIASKTCAAGFSPSIGRQYIIIPSIGPKKKPIVFRLISKRCSASVSLACASIDSCGVFITSIVIPLSSSYTSLTDKHINVTHHLFSLKYQFI